MENKEFIKNVKTINNFIVFALFFSEENAIYSAVRFQKLYFLFMKEFDFKSIAKNDDETNLFKSYHYGPYSEKFREGLSLLKRKDTITITFENKITKIDSLFLIDIDIQNDTNEYVKYYLNKEQLKNVNDFLTFFKEKYKENWVKFESEFKKFIVKINDLNINSLLLYVYKKYPEYTIKSKIKEEVLKNEKK